MRFFLCDSVISIFHILQVHLIYSINISAQTDFNWYNLLFWWFVSNYFHIVNYLLESLFFCLLKDWFYNVEFIFCKIFLLLPFGKRLFKMLIKCLWDQLKVNIKWLISNVYFRISLWLNFLFILSTWFQDLMSDILRFFLFRITKYWLTDFRITCGLNLGWDGEWWGISLMLIISNDERTVLFAWFLADCVQWLWGYWNFFIWFAHFIFILNVNLYFLS